MDKETLQRELSKGRVLLIRKNFDDAEIVYKNILKAEFDNLEANVGLLKCHSKNYEVFDNPDIDGDIEVIKTLFPDYDDEYFVSYVNLKQRGSQKVEQSDLTKLRLAEEALEKEREERDQYLGFIPEETLEFFPWYDDIEELKDDLYDGLIKKHKDEYVRFRGNYMDCLKAYNDTGDIAKLPFNYKSYLNDGYAFNKEEWALHIGVWLNEIENGEGRFIMNIYSMLIWPAIDDGMKAYMFKLKQHDINVYNELVLKFLIKEYEYEKAIGPIKGQNIDHYNRCLAKSKQDIEDWKKKIGK